jgi:polar amino acid transport system substrate-binding protein
LRHLILFCLTVPWVAGCVLQSLPHDPEETLGRVQQGILRVGISDNAPWTSITHGPDGVEMKLVQELARNLGVEVEWQADTENDLMRKLERFELDLVVAGLTKDTPWGSTIGLTRPYVTVQSAEGPEEHVFAVPPGENAWLRRVDAFLLTQRESVARLLQEPAGTGKVNQ